MGPKSIKAPNQVEYDNGYRNMLQLQQHKGNKSDMAGVEFQTFGASINAENTKENYE